MKRQAHVRADDWRVGVWRCFLRTHTSVVRKLERDLTEQAGIPLAWYDVLLVLAEAPQNRLRMADLADRVLLSRSGLTRLVDRLSAEGLVERQPFPGDARGLYTVLTPAGMARLRAAAPVHLTGITEYVLCRLSEDELRQLDGLLRKLEDPPAALP